MLRVIEHFAVTQIHARSFEFTSLTRVQMPTIIPL